MKVDEQPQSLEAERAVLGAVILDNELLGAVTPLVSSADAFASASNRVVFQAIVEMRSHGQLVDLVTLSSKMARDKLLMKNGGPSYLASLTDGAAVDRATVQQYAAIVREKYVLRWTLNLARNVAVRIKQDDSADDILVAARAEIDSMLGAQRRRDPERGPLLVPASEFLARYTHDIDWLVDGVIQLGSNGFIVGNPKSSKSWIAVDMALSLALGVPWMDFQVRQRTKVAIITREDTPDLTRWRMRRLLKGKGSTEDDLAGWIYVNSKDQSPQFKLDEPDQLAEMLDALKDIGPGFVVLDVLNVLHGGDENDQGTMRKVLDCAETIQRETGASLCIVHHFRKSDGTLIERMRGSSAIAGFAEWILGIGYANDDPASHVRYCDFECKAIQPHDRVHYEVRGEPDSDYGTRIERVEHEAASNNGNGRHQRGRFND